MMRKLWWVVVFALLIGSECWIYDMFQTAHGMALSYSDVIGCDLSWYISTLGVFALVAPVAITAVLFIWWVHVPHTPDDAHGMGEEMSRSIQSQRWARDAKRRASDRRRQERQQARADRADYLRSFPER